MNFFGHAAIARWHSTSAELIFGAMLPDFAHMMGAPLPRIRHPDVMSGVHHHHATDDVFHRTPTFRRLSTAASRQLEAMRLHRGGALAVGHVGVELLIDCALGQQTDRCNGYLAALRAGAPARLRGVEWASLDERRRFERLHDGLTRRGLLVVDPAPERIARRLQQVLGNRPRLALSPDDLRIVEDWARGAQVVVFHAASQLLEELAQGLERAFPSRYRHEMLQDQAGAATGTAGSPRFTS